MHNYWKVWKKDSQFQIYVIKLTNKNKYAISKENLSKRADRVPQKAFTIIKTQRRERG